MSTKEIEGKIYILKSEMENIIQQRISKVAKRANDAELSAKELGDKLKEQSKSIGTVDLLTQQVAEITQQLEHSRQRYTHHTAIASQGLTNPELVDEVSRQYQLAQKALPKKDRQPLQDWLSGHIATPEAAPFVLRPHLQALNSSASVATPRGVQQPQQPQQPPPKPAPAITAGRRAAPQPEPNLIDEALSSVEKWKVHRESIKDYIKNHRRSGINGQ